MRFAVVGAGNMIEALLSKATFDKNDNYIFYSPSGISAKRVAQSVGQSHCQTLEELSSCEALILAFKPANLNDFIKDYGQLFKGKIIISILAGITINKLQTAFGSDQIVRIMPNLHSQYSLGYNLFFYSVNTPQWIKEKINKTFKTSGKVFECCDEKELDSLTLFAGSAPAFIYQFSQIFEENIRNFAPNFQNARELLVYLLEGSSKTLSEETVSYSKLIEKVASKGGVTQQALDALESSGLGSIYKMSFEEAQKKIDEFKNS